MSIATGQLKNIEIAIIIFNHLNNTIMANMYSQFYIQIVLALKGRKHFVKEDFREELQMYISGIISGKDQKLYAI